LNRSAGGWLQASDELLEMLSLSMEYHRKTKGLFNPAILSDLKRVGYDRSLDDIPAYGPTGRQDPSARRSNPAFEDIDIDPDRKRVRMPPGMEIDLGGIAKGWIVSKAANLLQSYTETCAVSAGGDIRFIGDPADGSDWDVQLEDPRDAASMIAQLHVPPGGVATSSVMKRTWSQGDKVRHHLIDPRTGEPAVNDWLSVTVISPDLITADVYAKAILIAGENGLDDLLQTNEELTYIVVNQWGELSGSPDFKEFMYESKTESLPSAGVPS
jgi:thiamine biosynthesis lipoprotein